MADAWRSPLRAPRRVTRGTLPPGLAARGHAQQIYSQLSGSKSIRRSSTTSLPISNDAWRRLPTGQLAQPNRDPPSRSEEHTSELQSLMRISYAVFCLKKKNKNKCTLQYNTSLH